MSETDHIPYGFCKCGCGRETQIASQSRTARDWVKGEPKRYCQGHNNRGKRMASDVQRWREEDCGFSTLCWIWTQYRDPNGYGKTSAFGKVLYAHRVAYEEAVGPIPQGKEVDHACRQKGCVNPAHLRIGTHAENQQNVPSNRGSSSRYRGVHWVKRLGKWQATAQVKGKSYDLGRYDDEDEAGMVAREFRMSKMPFATG